jgi:murein DD-endopeptidase MepM/ murein hydrolase activator NlpD
MTLSEVKEFQQKQIDVTRGTIPGAPKNLGTGAVGKYQITAGTLQSLQSQMGLKDTDIFSPQLQDKMAVHLLNQRGLQKYLNRELPSGEFQNRIANVWASIPKTTGQGVYGQPIASNFSLPPPPSPTPTAPTNARITSGFGMRNIFGRDQHHDGIDVGVPSGTPIKSVKAGKIIFAGEQRGYGYSVEVKHDDDTSTFYAHLSSIGVRVGQSVGRGEVVGLSGGGQNDPGRGTSTGPHLHFELRVGGRKVDPGKDLALSSITIPPSLAEREPARESTTINTLSSVVADEESEASTVTRTIIVSQNNTQTITEPSQSQVTRVDYGNQLLNYTT